MLIVCKNTVLASKVRGNDGNVGSIHDVLFNAVLWNVRYIVVDTRSWLSGTKVLLSPSTVQQADWQRGVVDVNLATDQVKKSPGIDADAQISRQMEEKLAQHFQWPVYWGMGIGGTPNRASEPTGAISVKVEEKLIDEDPGLRSVLEVKGYHIEGTDGEIGYVEDFILDDEDWVLRYMIANTASWWPGRSVLVAPQWVESIRWSERKVHVALTQANFKEAPAFDPSVRVNRQHEEHLYDFHGREHYWK